LTPALGNSVFLTHGHDALLGVRSPRVSAYPHRAHLLGGVLDLLGTAELPASVDGLVAHLRKELHEEAGVGESDLEPGGSWPRLYAVVRDEFLGQPEALWQWETRIPLDLIGARLEPSEHSAPLQLIRDVMDQATWNLMTPIARLCWQRWSGRPAQEMPIFDPS
jgi:hypothetical protein